MVFFPDFGENMVFHEEDKEQKIQPLSEAIEAHE
jgi:hypothetical protein